jgi:tRNA modification GTPase
MRLKPHKHVLLELIATLEAGIDFAEDDVPVMDWPEIYSRIQVITADLENLVEGYRYGRIVREGLSLAIVGRPNVGKSSLFNRLLNEDRAIVTASPGTTRDLVAESANLCGIPLRFVDTAGIRDATDEAEKIGVEKTFRAVAESDLRLLVLDASEPWTEEDTALLRKLRPLGALAVACNKCDLPHRITQAELERLLLQDEIADSGRRGGGLGPAAGAQSAPLPGPAGGQDRTGLGPENSGDGQIQVVWTSALTGEGLPQLREKILQVATPVQDQGGEFITNLRHQQLIKHALRALARAREAAVQHTPHEMLLLDLYDALRALDSITGATYVDDVLGIIFSTFCVGK